MKRFLAAIDYIEDHLLSPLVLPDVAEHVGLSPAYFSRLFRALAGEPFGTYVRRRRLTIAAERLVSDMGSVRLIDLAFDCQYESQEAFTRAFKQALGSPPGAYRDGAPQSRSRWRHRLDETQLQPHKENPNMTPRYVDLDAFVVVGRRHHFNQSSKHGIPKLWETVAPEFANIPHRVGEDSFGVCTSSDGGEGSFDYLAGVPVSKVDALGNDWVAETIPRQHYAVFTHTHSEGDLHKSLQPTLAWIWGTWLASSRVEYAPGPDFEHYTERFDVEADCGEIDLYIPVVRP